MRFAAAATREEDSVAAARALAREARAGLVASRGDDGPADLALLFLSEHHAPAARRLAGVIRETLRPRWLLGCTAEGVLGAGDEIEREPGLSLLAARLPGVSIEPFSLTGEEWRTSDRGTLRGAFTGSPRVLLALADPFSTPADEMLAACARDLPGVPVVGGLASGATGPGGNLLIFGDAAGDEVQDAGVIGVALSGALRVETVVSQGCRPVGPPLRVTGSQGNVIETLRFRPALEMAQEALSELSEADQALLENGLYVGVAIDEYKHPFERGDFLVGNLLGGDAETGVLVLAEAVRAGQTIQFYLRDADSADEDLRALLRDRVGAGPRPAGALLVTCNGRGTRLFDAPGHDVGAVAEAVPGLPVAGFFAAGELGPVGGRSFVHGHTASIAFFFPE